MPQTRSATCSNALSGAAGGKLSQTPSSKKRKVVPPHGDDDATPSTKKLKKPNHTDYSVASALPLPLDEYNDQSMIDTILTFSFEDAKTHLINVDPRFAELFGRLKCKPFEHLEQLHPFRSLVQSILAQQISWLAARSITHKFLRLYDPSLPEKPTDFSHDKSPQSFFPTPHQVANTDITILKSAGLSTRKAEYVKDLATRFADGRLSVPKLLNANDEELVQMLTEVRGIGKWTADMFAIFTLRRPNILPVGDLGIQRGMLRWFGGAGFKIRPDKVEQQGANAAEKSEHARDEHTKPNYAEVGMVEAALSSRKVDGKIESASVSKSNPETSLDPGFDMNSVTDKEENLPPSTSASAMENPPFIPPTLPVPIADQPQSVALPPPAPVSPLTPLLAQASSQGNSTDGYMKPWTKPLPNGLTPTSMKSRLNRKKAKYAVLFFRLGRASNRASMSDMQCFNRGALLTPQEMEALATEWAPYRSLAVYYMWALTDQD
ncbi:DNA glycosylase [Pisolithus marmoratus]|nr:DNA glycosylase [Pisolithus marmoratus]